MAKWSAVFVEKVLRVQPNVKRLYLLIRAEDDKSAKLRFQNEVRGRRTLWLLAYIYIYTYSVKGINFMLDSNI